MGMGVSQSLVDGRACVLTTLCDRSFSSAALLCSGRFKVAAQHMEVCVAHYGLEVRRWAGPTVYLSWREVLSQSVGGFNFLGADWAFCRSVIPDEETAREPQCS